MFAMINVISLLFKFQNTGPIYEGNDVLIIGEIESNLFWFDSINKVMIRVMVESIEVLFRSNVDAA